MSTDGKALSYDEAVKQIDNALPALLATIMRPDGVYNQADMIAIGGQFYDWQVKHPDVDEAIAEHVYAIGNDDAFVSEGNIEAFIEHHSKVWWIEFISGWSGLPDEPVCRIARGLLPSQLN